MNKIRSYRETIWERTEVRGGELGIRATFPSWNVEPEKYLWQRGSVREQGTSHEPRLPRQAGAGLGTGTGARGAGSELEVQQASPGHGL